MGSFGMTPEMEEAIKASKNKEKGVDTEITPEMESDIKSSGVLDKIQDLELEMGSNDKKPEETEELEETKPEKTLDEILTERIEMLSKSLRYTVSEDEKWKMFLSYTHEKDDVVIIPGKFVASFRILNSAESKEVGSKLSKFMEGSHLEEDYKNETTLQLLSRGVTAMGKFGHSKKLTNDVEERYKIFESLPVIFLDKIARKWNDFTELTYAIMEKEYGEGNS